MLPDSGGHFGPYGGKYVPETLMSPLRELEEAYTKCKNDPDFQRELQYYLTEYAGQGRFTRTVRLAGSSL